MNNKEKSKIQKEIVDSLPSPCHGLLTLAPRVGKTKIGIDIIKKEKPKRILWVTPSTKLRDVDIPEEFKTWRATTYLKKTDIICYASMARHVGRYDLIILDEYQDLTSGNSTPLFNKRITYKTIIGLSGTHPVHEEKRELYKELKLKKLIEISIDEAVDKKLIAPYDITVVECRLESVKKTVEAGSKTKKFMNTEEKHYNYLNRIIVSKMYSGNPVPQFFYLNRMRFLYNLKSKNDFAKKFVEKLKGRTLVFSGGIKQSEHISKYTFNSKTDDKHLDLFKGGKIDTLSLVNSGGVGHTFRDVDNLVIVQVNSNKKGDGTQKIARSLVLQKGYRANIYILCTVNTVDEKWKDKVLEDFGRQNVKHVSYKNYE